jgi:quinol-cytochrome oxidoreductase complex cytochrome b subunit
VPGERVRETLGLARRAHRAALAAAHYEDLRAILETWRYLHRWVAALMILLLLLHIGYAIGYGSAIRTGGAP